jgi:hypothetical protein
VSDHPLWSLLKLVMQTFWVLYGILRKEGTEETEIQEFEQMAVEFGKLMVFGFEKHIQKFVYLHLLVKHCGDLMRQNGGLGKWSCEGFEHINHVLKELRSKLSSHGGGRNNIGRSFQALTQGVKRVNAKSTERLVSLPKRQYKCGMCHKQGHNSSTCPAQTKESNNKK